MIPESLQRFRPPIRSSDYRTCCSDPFRYLLTRRLGITPALSYTEALNRGSWFHTIAEAYFDLGIDHYRPAVLSVYERRIKELRGACASLGRDPAAALEIEHTDMLTTLAWFQSALLIPINGRPFQFHLMSDEVRLLGCEVTVLDRQMENIIQCDMLLYNKFTNTIDIVDFKTTSLPPSKRLATCPFEFQTLHYFNTANDMIEVIAENYALPTDTKIGGVVHVAFQKPTIKICGQDRDCTETEHVLKSGPCKGQVEIRREYFGEPKLENFVDRCRDWYLGEGAYSHRASEESPVNISYTPASLLLSAEKQQEYAAMRSMIERFRNEPANLAVSFPKGPIYNFDSFEPFYLLNSTYWPSIIESGFTIVDYNKQLPTSPITTRRSYDTADIA